MAQSRVSSLVISRAKASSLRLHQQQTARQRPPQSILFCRTRQTALRKFYLRKPSQYSLPPPTMNGQLRTHRPICHPKTRLTGFTFEQSFPALKLQLVLVRVARTCRRSADSLVQSAQSVTTREALWNGY